MSSVIRGTTPTLSFGLPFETDGIAEAMTAETIRSICK